MDFKQLQPFVAVIRCESSIRAAGKLGILQLSVSTHGRTL
jgi:DNA-binding transcriptional LysR family regulator